MGAEGLKIISWNVNGIRSVWKKGFLEFVGKHQPDILCLQETRGHSELSGFDLRGFHAIWNHAEKKGYSGTTIFSKIRPLSSMVGIDKKPDTEGRVIVAEYPQFYLVNVYTPNAKRDLSRLDYRWRVWDRSFYRYVKKLERKKPVIFCGDLNVAHKEIDLAHPRANRGNHGFTDEERAGFDRYIQHGFIDTFRELYADGGHYTWWSPLQRARDRNVGWRIDYVCMSRSLRRHLLDAFILSEVMGSDHCPVGVVVNAAEGM